MNSQEADRYVEQYPWLSLRSESRKWCISNTATESETWGRTREEAVTNYRDKYDPPRPDLGTKAELPVPGFDPLLSVKAIKRAFADSAKYRRIVTKFQQIDRRVREFTLEDSVEDLDMIRNVLGDDLKPPHCNECGQSLDKDTT